LTPEKQKEYKEQINSTKRIDTQQVRTDKMKPMILKGEGLNDTYKN
jgi:uncharacterized protein YdeI (YjbR/CyaY-like superfamily)